MVSSFFCSTLCQLFFFRKEFLLDIKTTWNRGCRGPCKWPSSSFHFRRGRSSPRSLLTQDCCKKKHVVDPDKNVTTISWSGVGRCRTCFEFFFWRTLLSPDEISSLGRSRSIWSWGTRNIWCIHHLSGWRDNGCRQKNPASWNRHWKVELFFVMCLQSPHVCIQASG